MVQIYPYQFLREASKLQTIRFLEESSDLPHTEFGSNRLGTFGEDVFVKWTDGRTHESFYKVI